MKFFKLCSHKHFLAQDMAAHSACDFGGGKAEKLALAKYRQVIWQGRVLNAQFTDEELRNQGRCPLTPEEIGLLLAALGFSNNTSLYLASHKVCHLLPREILCFCFSLGSLTMKKIQKQLENSTDFVFLSRFMVEKQGSLLCANYFH